MNNNPLVVNKRKLFELSIEVKYLLIRWSKIFIQFWYGINLLFLCHDIILSIFLHLWYLKSYNSNKKCYILSYGKTQHTPFKRYMGIYTSKVSHGSWVKYLMFMTQGILTQKDKQHTEDDVSWLKVMTARFLREAS